MGGNALSAPSVRLQADRYATVSQSIMMTLAQNLIGRRAAEIKAYANKPDFGDMDILIEGGEGYDPNLIATLLGANEVVRNGDCTSIGVQVDEGILQVDLIKTPAESFDFAYCYFAMNDLGNLIGRVAHKTGFKLGHDGLLYTLKNPDEADSTHVIAELVLTRNWDEAIEFLGYCPKKYRDGLQWNFKEVTDIYEYVVGSKYFSKDIFRLENRNAKARVRDNKRKTYTGFLEWMESPLIVDASIYNQKSKEELRKDCLNDAFARFPGFAQSYDDKLVEFGISKIVQSKFNGMLVAKISGFEGQKLGNLIKSMKGQFDSQNTFNTWVLNTSANDIAEKIKQSCSSDFPSESNVPSQSVTKKNRL